VPVIGLLSAQSADGSKNGIVAFLQSLKESGFVEGHNLAVEYRYADNEYDRLPALAADLIRRGVAVMVTTDTPSGLTAKNAESSSRGSGARRRGRWWRGRSRATGCGASACSCRATKTIPW
jgi:hypothetical protein